MRTAVVGHTEWVEFVRVDKVPAAGDIEHASETWEGPGGSGAVAVVQLLKLSGDATFYTALGDDELGHRAKRELEALGVRVEAVFRPAPQRRALTFIDSDGERTIVTVGDRLGPSGEDPLRWGGLTEMGALYFTAGDPAALQAARRARVGTATTRVMTTLAEARVLLDAAIGSANDPSEGYREGVLDPPPRLVVLTSGKDGGRYRTDDGSEGTFPAPAVPGPAVDAYGAGDSFAAGLTFALGEGLPVPEAVALAARCGAAALTGRGPFGGQLELSR